MIDKEKIMELTQQFLVAIGEDITREGLIDTPLRVANMFNELLVPERANAKYKMFEADNYYGTVLVKKIDFSSICEHHLLPFIGKVDIAYIPNEKIIGISKLARIIDKHSKKLQLQERLANDIVNDINQTIKPKGIAIYMEAKHLCMNIRGILQREASTVTTVFIGDFIEFKMQERFMDMIAI
jgi:GTP cyclohydrolase I